jgi:hypothetical protein
VTVGAAKTAEKGDAAVKRLHLWPFCGEFVGMPAILARIIHEVSAAADDAPHPAVFARLGVLQVLSSTRPRPSGRKPHWARHLAALATKPYE